jgi:hypothetical protein
MTDQPGQADESGVADALRTAIERTLEATAPARERAGELVDEIARRGQEAREEIARRGGEAQAELGRQLEALERRMAAIEELLRPSDDDNDDEPKPQAQE